MTRAPRTGAGEDVGGFWLKLSAGRVSVTGQACQEWQIIAIGAVRAPFRVNQRLIAFCSIVVFFTPLLTRKVNGRLCLRNTAWKLFGLPLMTHQTLATPLPGCLCDVGGKASGGPEAWKADSEHRVKTGCFRRIPAKFQGQGRETKGKTGARLQFAHGTDTGWVEGWGCWDYDLNHGVAITWVGLFQVFFSLICFLCEMLADGELRLRNPPPLSWPVPLQ